MTMTGTDTGATGSRVRWRRVLFGPTVRTWLLYLPMVVISSAMAASTWDSRRIGGQDVPQISTTAMLIWLVGVVLGVSLFWRRRHPVAVVAITAVATLLLPLDPVAALIAFGSLAVRRLDRLVAAMATLTFLAVLVSTWRDGRGPSTTSSFWQMLLSGPDTPTSVEPMSLWITLAIALGLTAISVGLAMLIRDQQRSRSKDVDDRAHRRIVAGLNDELARQSERERLAQEVHDALGHRLSLLSLHAGALQLRAGEDARLRESADLVRSGAEQAMTDLRSLLTMLRAPGGSDIAHSVPSLRDISLLIDETSRTGTTLISTVQLESLDGLDDLTSRSAFRIAQELLTNARRHAPGLGVRFLMRATSAGGVEIEAANHLTDTASRDLVPGSGLTGITTRVDQLGGQARCWVDDQRVFRVAVFLPWVPRADTRRSGPDQTIPVPGHAGQEAR